MYSISTKELNALTTIVGEGDILIHIDDEGDRSEHPIEYAEPVGPIISNSCLGFIVVGYEAIIVSIGGKLLPNPRISVKKKVMYIKATTKGSTNVAVPPGSEVLLWLADFFNPNGVQFTYDNKWYGRYLLDAFIIAEEDRAILVES